MDDRTCEVRGCTAAIEVVHLGSPLCDRHWKARAKAEERTAPAPVTTQHASAGEAGTTEDTMAPKTTTPTRAAKVRATTTKRAPANTAKPAEAAPPLAKAAGVALPRFPEPLMPGGDLMTFAVRLTQAESAAIHQAAGPGGASKFARAVLSAAARGDAELFAKVVEVVKARAAAR